MAADGDVVCFSLTFGTVWRPLAWCIIRPCIQYTVSAASMAGAWSYTGLCGRCVVYTDPNFRAQLPETGSRSEFSLWRILARNCIIKLVDNPGIEASACARKFSASTSILLRSSPVEVCCSYFLTALLHLPVKVSGRWRAVSHHEWVNGCVLRNPCSKQQKLSLR